MANQPTSRTPAPDTRSCQSGPRRLPVGELLHGADQVILLHQDQEYHLRVTRAGKLILTK